MIRQLADWGLRLGAGGDMGHSFKSYRDLEVWQKARALVKEIYDLTDGYPGEEKFGLVSKIRR